MRLEGNIVVVDEAHNLVDAVNNVHSALVSAQQLATAQSALDNYFQRFRSVLAPGVLIFKFAPCVHILHVITWLMPPLIQCTGIIGCGCAGNSKHIQTLICLASTLQRSWDEPAAPAGPTVHTVNDFLFSTELDNMNFFRLIR